ncbi:hypothetical protein U5B43_07985 [Campylobacter sp. 9BO]|uniref:hypothetical protein n=1 Tax=Campylobacter sp. 9BO TaxID=3424759 RepID=UPI003D337FDE
MRLDTFSGSRFNPAVSVSLLVGSRFNGKDLLPYYHISYRCNASCLCSLSYCKWQSWL